ncbi:MAG: hypothetical protein PHG06_07925 [Parabacteroides sp.]|nr:hypothetical protein [Parabacteroides sp.]
MINSDLHSLWEQRLAEYENSGQTIKAWCQEQAIKEHQFYYWRKKLCMEQAELGQPVKWLPLDMDRNKQTRFAQDSIAVHIGEVTIELKSGFDQHLFREIIQALQTV